MKLNGSQLGTIATMIDLADAEDLASIVSIVKDRQQQIRSEQVMSLKPGDRVRLTGSLRPKYLLGLTATVKSIGTKSVRVDTRAEVSWGVQAPRFVQANLKIPITCVEVVSHG
jgi:preprotein translocase subunit YajC